MEVQNQGVEGEVKSFDVRVLGPKNYYVERKGCKFSRERREESERNVLIDV